MEKKVLMINGSFRRKNTYGVLAQIGEILKGRGVDCEILNLSDYDVRECHGCDESCINNLGCTTKDDDMRKLKEKVLQSDGLVLASPVYLRGVTSLFKAFADRTNCWFHNPETAGLPVLLVATTASTGLKETGQFLKSFAVGLGARLGGFIARSGPTFGKPVEEKELKKFLSLLEKDKDRYKPSMNEIVTFEVQKVLAMKLGGEGNKKFWEERDWTGRTYYYDCRMNVGKKLFSKLMFGILSKAIK